MSLKIRLLILTIALLAPIYSYAIEIDRVVAVINKEVITWGELYRAMEFELRRQMESGLKILTDEEKAEFFKANEAQFLEEMIDRKVQLQEAKRLGIGVTDMELDEEIKHMQKVNSMSHEQFVGALEKEGLTLQGYREILTEEITFAKVISREIRSKITITEDEIKGYMTGNADTVFGYRVWQIFLKRPSDPKDEKEVVEKAFMVFDMLRKGAEFQSLAKEYSEEPAGREGGDLGFIKTSEMADAFKEALKTIQPDGMSMPFWSAQGIHIIKVEESSGTAQGTEEIKEILFERKLLDLHKQWLKSLREKSFVEVKL